MTVFAGYARYYDLLYREKDYSAEARWIVNLLRAHSARVRSLLEIGSGTGLHAVHLAELGFEVMGIDMSPGMLHAAEKRRAGLTAELAGRLRFAQGDARDFRLGRRFDAVISLFHVMSYQTSNEDLANAFASARAHLGDGGIFLFDCWYGPAVIRQWPGVTVKELSDEETHVRRVATPVVNAMTNVVDVTYTVDVTDRTTGDTEQLRETHSMRYLFSPEVELALRSAGMELVDSRGWLSEGPPGFDTWGACFVARA